MEKVTLNIGLNNNPFTVEQLKKIIKEVYSNDLEIRFEEVDSTWEGEHEPTLVVSMIVNFRLPYIETIKNMKPLSLATNQDAIGVKINEFGVLVYKPTFEGERMLFNEDYFINL